MNKIKFSDDQLRAINARDHDVLVSAGAGSGKTAVLTERIYRLAKEDNTLDKFLVLTFTTLAANEMKDRTRKKLTDDSETLHLASEVDNAHIETFDSFCLYLVKKYFYVLDVSKNLNIIDKSILTIRRKILLDELFERKCLEKENAFVNLVSSYSIKDHDLIKDFIIKLLEASDKKADNYGFINSLLSQIENDSLVDKMIEDAFIKKKKTIGFLNEQAAVLQDIKDANNLLEFFKVFDDCNDYDSLRETLLTSKLPSKPSNNEVTDQDFRNALKDIYDKEVKIDKNADYGSSKDIKEHYESIKPHIRELVSIALEVEHGLDNFKKEKNAYSFGDISRFVLTLLKNEHIRQEISDSFDYIMIDEYQDTNDIQDTVINAISKNNVYMVGDVKQSIYRFRGADCSIFQDKYETFKKGIGGEEIDLNTSYRSRREVVNFVNELFKQLLTKENNPIDYSNGHHFGFGRDQYEKIKSTSSYTPEVYSYFYEKAAEVPGKESNIIASDILRRIAEGYQVMDFDTGKLRNCQYKDFAIIMDRGTTFDEYRKTFTQRGIPLKVESKEQLFGSDIAVLVKNLVKMLYLAEISDYGVKYKHAFMSIARSFLIEMNDDELHNVIKDDKVLQVGFAQKLELIKERLRYAPIKEVLKTLYEEFGIYDRISKITSYYANTHKLEHLLSLAGDMDVLGYTLEDFVKYFDDLDEIELDIDYRDSDAQENSVTLINIHGSKGLEYPIVYFSGLSKEFNESDLKSSFLLSEKYGISIPSTTSSWSSLSNHLIKDDIRQKDLEEKIRLLYVAITRTKEKVIILNGGKEGKTKPILRMSSIRSLLGLLQLTNVLEKYSTPYTLGKYNVSEEISQEEVAPIAIKAINVESHKLVHNRASKVVDEEVNESILDFGSELHTYLENMNLESDNLDYISNKQMRRYVSNVKNSPLFKEVKNNQVRHEYHFFDDVNNVEGYIDALIIKDNEIDIIDFKLKKIDDEEYDKQLRTYKRYLSEVTKLPIKMYLLAAITGEAREVKDE